MGMKRQPGATPRVQSIVDPILEKPLLRLHAATDVDSFWKAVQDVIQAALPTCYIGLTLQPVLFRRESPNRRRNFRVAFSRACRSRNISALIRIGTLYSSTIFFPMSVILEGLHFTVVVSCR